MDIQLYRESSSESLVRIVNLEKIEWCKTVKIMRENQFMKILIEELVKTPMGIYLEVCSRIGDYKAYNIAFHESQYATMWPDADYQLHTIFYDKTDRNIMNFSYSARLAHLNDRVKKVKN